MRIEAVLVWNIVSQTAVRSGAKDSVLYYGSMVMRDEV